MDFTVVLAKVMNS